MKDDVMKRLAAVRPARLSGEGSAEPELRRAELNRAFAQPRGVAKRRNRTWLLAPAAAFTAGAVALGLVMTSPGNGARSAPPKSLTLSDRSMFLAAAVNAANLPIGSYWACGIVSGQTWLIPAKTGDYAISGALSESFEWTAAKTGGGNLFYGRSLPSRPLGPDDVAAWRRAGSPHTFRVWAGDHYDVFNTGATASAHEEPREWGADVPQARAGGRFYFPTFSKKDWLTVEQLQKLPIDPDKLAGLLFSPATQVADPARNNWIHDAAHKVLIAASIFRDAPIPPRVQAAMMRALLAQPGVKPLGRVTDVLGRKGVAIGADWSRQLPAVHVVARKPVMTWEDQGYVDRSEIIFDQATGAFLGYQQVLVQPGGIYRSAKPGTVLEYELARSSGWTDKKPAPPETSPFMSEGLR